MDSEHRLSFWILFFNQMRGYSSFTSPLFDGRFLKQRQGEIARALKRELTVRKQLGDEKPSMGAILRRPEKTASANDLKTVRRKGL